MTWQKVVLNTSSFRNGREPRCHICDRKLEKGQEVWSKPVHCKTKYYDKTCYNALWFS